MEFTIKCFFILFTLGISFISSLIAHQKGYNFINWFLLSLFWGIIGLIILTYSDKKGEHDILAKVLWSIIFIPIYIVYRYIFMN